MKIVTHNGPFHPDDVFACAALSILHAGTEISIIRTRDPNIIALGTLVVDVGMQYDGEKCFDHHQGGLEPRANGVPYASFGLVWKRFGAEISGSPEVADHIDIKLIENIDAADNNLKVDEPVIPGVYPYILFDAIRGFYPLWDDPEPDYDAGFYDALEFAIGILKREIAETSAYFRGRAFFKGIYENAPDKRIIVLDRKYPYEECLADYPEILFIAYPNAADGTWHVKTARDDIHSFTDRKPFPESWRGKRNDELATITGVPDAVFCHIARFLAVAKSREGAIKLAELAVAA